VAHTPNLSVGLLATQELNHHVVIPAKAGIQLCLKRKLDPRLRGGDVELVGLVSIVSWF
jgi:hypothetical protein